MSSRPAKLAIILATAASSILAMPTAGGAAIGSIYGGTDAKGDTALSYADITAVLVKNESTTTYSAFVATDKSPWATPELRKFLRPQTSIFIYAGASSDDYLMATPWARADGTIGCELNAISNGVPGASWACNAWVVSSGIKVTFRKDGTVARKIDQASVARDFIQVVSVVGAFTDTATYRADISS